MTSPAVPCGSLGDGGGEVRSLSVRDLVRRRCGDESDPWHLALVQRAKVWDDVRMRHLLDSLLASYPIGTLLICRVREGSNIIRADRESRDVEEADAEAWQLLDGQQRIHALYCMLTEHGDMGRFYLDMTVERPEPAPSTRRGRKATALRYIAWRPGRDDDKPLDHRARYLDLSRWYQWAESSGRSEPLDPAASLQALREIDPAFGEGLDAPRLEQAACRLAVLLDLWRAPRVPVQRVVIDTPQDLLEVFTRVNLAGVPLSGGDAYFAAVKTWWPHAESHLKRACEVIPALGRYRALRLFSRLAARARRGRDPVKPTVDNLAGENGKALLDALESILSKRTAARDRMATLFRVLRATSKLGWGLSFVHETLWDAVLAWAAVARGVDEAYFRQNVGRVNAFLLGATLFAYPQIFRDRFHRIAMTEALQAGLDGDPFPVERILSASHGAWESLQSGRRTVSDLGTRESKLGVAERHPGLLLAIAQCIPYGAHAIDLDHIFPQAQAYRMRPMADTGRRRHHRLRKYVWRVGNLWAMEARANSSLQDKPPVSKFEQIRSWQEEGSTLIWPRARWWLPEDDQRRFEAVDRMLRDDPEDINVAMELFRDIVEERGERLLAKAFQEVPGAERFARDADVERKDVHDMPDITEAIGLDPLPDSVPQSAN